MKEIMLVIAVTVIAFCTLLVGCERDTKRTYKDIGQVKDVTYLTKTFLGSPEATTIKTDSVIVAVYDYHVFNINERMIGIYDSSGRLRAVQKRGGKNAYVVMDR